MAFVQDSRPASSWTKDTVTSASWSADSRPSSTWAKDNEAASTWIEDGRNAGAAAYFDTWDDSFDLIETYFDDDNEVPGQEFTEDTHP